jgi:hypothetical protein
MVIQGEEHHKKPGRPRLLYRLPSLAVLVWCYGLETFHFDEVEAEKLKQLAAYKAEVHAALPRRRPGEYGRTELADRLGVSKPTSRNYDRRAKLRVTPQFATKELSSRDIVALPKEGEGVRQYGIWLQDRHGRKYPPLRECAELISGHGGAVYEVRQLKNHYAEGRSSNDGSPTAGSTGPSDGESRDNR